MYASGSSPPPQDLDVSISTPNSAPETAGPNNGNATSQQALAVPIPSRKRKRGQAATLAASPAPSDPGSIAGNGATETLLASRTDLYARPLLNIARGPGFIPVSEDSEWYRTDSAAINRLGYRYVPAGINPPGFITPCRTIESNPTSFRISWEDRSPFLKVTRDGLGLGGSKGFRSARCNAPMREGKWYLEVKVEVGGGDHVGDIPESSKADGSHVRLGWGRREAPLNGPAGLDGYSYGYRDKTGEKVTISRPRPYGKPFKSGDIIGMYISLPPLLQPNKKDPHDPAHIHRERIPIDLKGQEVFEILEYPASKEMSALMESTFKPTNSASVPSTTKKPATGVKLPDRTNAPANPNPKTPAAVPSRPLPVLQGSRIAFFINGECQGTAFQNIYDFLPLPQADKRKVKGRRVKEGVKEHRENPFDDGTLGYYPMISVFNDATVKLNPGPDFEFPPPPDIDALLDGKHDSGHNAASGNAETPDASSFVKTEPGATTLDVSMDVDEAKSSHRTWRPAIERYPEFMEEQWALDALEEEEAKVEFEKQKAREEAGAASKAARGRKNESKKATVAKVSAGSRKKKPAAQAQSEDTSKAGTPALDEALVNASTKPLAGEEASRARKRSKKAEGQAALGLAAPQQGEASTPRSASGTPAGTPPPPSISSTAAAAAAAHLHLHHHPINGRQDISSRPSPSPLRQSTAYRESDEDDETGKLQRERDSLSVLIGPASHAPRSRAPPGSKEGRQRAAAAAAAAAAQVWSSVPPPSTVPTSISPPSQQQRGRGGSLMSLAAIAVTAPALPTPSSKTPISISNSNLLLAPSPVAPRLSTVRTGATTNDHIGESDDDDAEDDFIAATRTPRSDVYPYDEEEEEEEEEGGASDCYEKGGVGAEEEEESVPGDDLGEGEDEGATTDGDFAYPYDNVRRGGGVDMAGEDTDDGGGTLGDDMDGHQRGTRSRSPS